MSDILIRGMELPKDDEQYHRITIYGNGQVIIDHGTYYEEAEAIELPEHGRLIDADALMAKACPKRYVRKCFTDCEYYDHTDRGNCGEIKYKLYCLIEAAPTIIPADGGAE